MLLPCSWRREAEKRPAEGEKTGCHGKTPSQRQLLRRLAFIKPKARPMKKTRCHGKTPSQRQLLRRLALIKPKARPMKKTGCHGKTPSRRQSPGFVTRSKPKARPMKKVHKLVTILRPKPIDNRQKKGYNLVAIKLQANCTIAFFMISPYDPDADLSPPTAVLELRFWVCINS